MTDRGSKDRDILGDLGRIVAGVGMLAFAAANVIAASKRGPKADQRPGAHSLGAFLREHGRNRRRPPEAGVAARAVPPRGPLPKQGGAAAMLDLGG